MRNFRGLISVILTGILLLFSGNRLYSAEKKAQITCTLQSRKDGSLWMGTKEDGLLRIGRNGRQIVYNKASGYLSSDTIEALSMEDNSGTILILDGNGNLYSYTSVSGFGQIQGFQSPVLALKKALQTEFHYAATEEKLYKFSSKTSPELLTELPFSPEKIEVGDDETIWIIGKSGVAFLVKNANLKALSADSFENVSNSKQFEFETYIPEQSEPNNKAQIWVWILTACLLASISLIIIQTLSRKKIEQKQASQPEEVKMPEKPQEIPEKTKEMQEKPEIKEPAATLPATEPKEEQKPAVTHIETAKKTSTSPPKIVPENRAEQSQTVSMKEIREKMSASAFGEQVLKLVEDNLDNPDFGVEQISEALGISRIHVNRRLKSETGFSPSLVVKTLRMEKARILLSDGNHTIAQVATSCGFSSASYFSTAFKDYYGISPSDFLESNMPSLI